MIYHQKQKLNDIMFSKSHAAIFLYKLPAILVLSENFKMDAALTPHMSVRHDLKTESAVGFFFKSISEYVHQFPLTWMKMAA